MIYTDLIPLLLIPAIRSLVGWLTASCELGRRPKFAWRKLVQTELKLGITGIALFLSAEQYLPGMDVSAVATGLTTYIMDRWLGHMTDNNNVTKR